MATKSKPTAEKKIRDIRRKTRRKRSSEKEIRVVLEGLRGECSIAELRRREGIAESLYYSWSKDFLEAGKRRLNGDTAREATSEEVKSLRAEMSSLKEALAESVLENYFLPGELKQAIGRFVDHYNQHRYRESLQNLTPADVFTGRGNAILERRAKIKRRTLQQPHLQHHRQAA